MATDMRVSSQWYHRPDDQRFTNLHAMYAACFNSAQNAEARVIDAAQIKVFAKNDKPDDLRFIVPPESGKGSEVIAAPSHWSFGQMCGLVSAPAGYLRKLPAVIAGINLQHGLVEYRAEKIKTYTTVNGDTHLRAATGPEYGRIYDYEVVDALRKIAGNGVDDTHWRVPGIWGVALDEVTKENTTLFASDRDVFVFLVDEQHPIVIGKLPNGEDDVVYRGFYTWNSEVGSRSFGIATFLFRKVCGNRIIWGQEDFVEYTLRHSKLAPQRFLREAAPALETYAKADPMGLIRGIDKARAAIVARGDDERRTDFLMGRGFTKPESTKIINAVLQEEGRPAESVWDFVQGITAVARDIPHQDARVDFERRATKLLQKAVK